MMIRYVVRRGDPITGGGIVLGRIGMHIYNLDGRDPTAEGLMGRCGVCGEIGRIVCVEPRPDHAPDNIRGFKLALTGDVLICKCPKRPKLVHTSTRHAILIDDQATTSTSATTSSPSTVTNMAGTFDEQIQFLTSDGVPLADTAYTLTLADGTAVAGQTDAIGCTARFYTETPTDVTGVRFQPDMTCGCTAEVLDLAGGARGNLEAPGVFDMAVSGIKTNGIIGSMARFQLVNKGRPLTPGEIAMIKPVFKDAIRYDAVRIHGDLPGWMGFAIAPFGSIHFPSDGYRTDFSIGKPNEKIWFVHEMTHVWQFQLGFSTAKHGVNMMARGGYPNRSYRYDLHGVDRGKRMPQFNMEQQAELVSHYFDAVYMPVDGTFGHPQRVADLNLIRFALDGFLRNPANAALLPTTDHFE